MNDISESETKVMFERLKDWLNEECGRKVVDLVTDDFDGDYIHFRIFSVHIYDYTWDFYGDFLFGHEYATPSGQSRYRNRSVFEIVESYLNTHDKACRPVESALRKLLSLKGVGSLAELELRLAAMGEN